ncbi:MAG: hypothetical protein KAS32_23750 [Candidatus Peribacteraceae bacterium]|nr:hypothetical protein [Candidatus Peribacteraceae bacterium]
MAILTSFFHYKDIEPEGFISTLNEYMKKESVFKILPGNSDDEPGTIRVDTEVGLDSVRDVYSALKNIPNVASKSDTPFNQFTDKVSIFDTDINVSCLDPTTTLTALSIMRTVDSEMSDIEISDLWNVINGMTTEITKLRQDHDILRSVFDKSGAVDFIRVTTEFMRCFKKLGVEPDLTITRRIH